MSPRHEITHADGTHEIVEGTPGGKVAALTVLGLSAWAIGSLAVSFWGGLGTLGAGGGAVGSPAAAGYSAPNTPTATAVMISDTSGYATTGAFGGTSDDSISYTVFEFDSLRGTGWDLVTPDTQSYGVADVLRSDTIFTFTANDTFKVRALHHGMASSLSSSYSVVDTFVANFDAVCGGSPAYVDDLSSYADKAAFIGSADWSYHVPNSQWADTTHITFQTTNGPEGGTLNWFRFNHHTADSLTTQGMEWDPWASETPQEIWVEFYYYFDDHFTMSTGQDHKWFLIGNIPSAERWEFKPGYFGTTAFRMDGQGGVAPEFKLRSDGTELETDFWDGTWHSVRLHYKRSTNDTTNDGEFHSWVDGVAFLDTINFPAGPATGSFNRKMNFSADVRVNGTVPVQWGMAKPCVYTSDPGW